MKRLKDQEFTEYAIKIRRSREVYAIGKASRKYRDKFFYVDIRDVAGRGIMFAVPITRHYGRSLRRVFREIREELHL